MSELHDRSEHAKRLERARDDLADVERRIADRGESDVETAAEAYRNAASLLDSYVDRATGTGRENFTAYVELEGRFATLVENLPEDVPASESFEAALEAIDKRRLSESDFERAEAALEPAERFADLLDERDEAREELAAARTAARRRLGEIDEEIADRERLLELASADLDAPVERLREPIDTYDDAIREAFEGYRLDASAREVFAFLDRTRWYPFVAFDLPPAELREYVETNPAGEYTIPELLEYTDYSRSKLSHYVDDADELKRRVATNRTALDRIDGDPLTNGWPPDSAPVLRRRIRELIPLAARIAGEDLVVRLREIRDLTRDPEYERLRTAAVATDKLGPDERERLTDGRVEDELEALRAERDRLSDLLDEDDPV